MKRNNTTRLWIIFVTSSIAVLLSLYYWLYWDLYSNIADGVLFDKTRWIRPCDLCWYIRIAQYPIALISWLALFYKEYVSSKFSIIWLALFWFFVSGYKALLERWILSLWESSTCSMWASTWCDQATYLLWTWISMAAAWFLLFMLTIILAYLNK